MERTAIPPCHRNKTFTNPIEGTPAANQARALCATCPLIKECALDALKAGDSIDGHVTRPATGVIQAGVFCTGNTRTLMALAKVAELPEDEWPIISDTTPRNPPPPFCKSCKQPMVGWTRDEVPAGRVMHHARGYCTACRAEYRNEMKRLDIEATKKVTHYDGGRTRTKWTRPDTPEATPQDTQMELFSL